MAQEWTEQISEMSAAWQETQKSLWEGWYKMASGGFPFTATNGNETIEGAVKDLQTSQQAMLRLLDFSNNAWKNIFSQVKSGEDWQTTLNKYSEELRESLSSPIEWMQTSQDASNMWKTYAKQWEVFGSPWGKVLQQAPQALNAGGANMVEWSQSFWDAYDRSIGRLVDSPGVGLPRELNHTLSEGFVTWQKKQQATAEYQALMVDTLVNAFEGFMKVLAVRAEKGEPVHTLREFIKLWTKTADDIFVETFETEEYIAAQWQLLNTNTAYRLKQREIMEIYLRGNDLPTLSDIDEAHKNIYELRKGFRELKKSIGNVKPAPAPDKGEGFEAIEVMQETIKSLQAEIETLKAELDKKANKRTRKRTTPKSSKKEESSKSEEGES